MNKYMTRRSFAFLLIFAFLVGISSPIIYASDVKADNSAWEYKPVRTDESADGLSDADLSDSDETEDVPADTPDAQDEMPVPDVSASDPPDPGAPVSEAADPNLDFSADSEVSTDSDKPTDSEDSEDPTDSEDPEDTEDEYETRNEYLWMEPRASEITASPLTYGDVLTEIAMEQFVQHPWEQCHALYSSTLHNWSADFVFWCAGEAGLTGKGQPFGAQSSTCAALTSQLLSGGAQVYFPEDNEALRAGDILLWWNNSRPGTQADGVDPDSVVYVGIVAGWDGETASVIAGNCGTWSPSRSYLGMFTCQLDQNLLGNMYVMAVLRPDYAPLYDGADRGRIQRCLSWLLYWGSDGKMVCDYDGYTTLYGRHEGMDFRCSYGAAVHAVAEGVVTRIFCGTLGEQTLGLVCVYEESLDRTVCYLHLTPAQELQVGQRIEIGDYIGTEDNWGAASPHTHLEVVSGYSLAASISVNDPVLDNEDPYPFWAVVLSRIKVKYHVW